MAHDFNNLEALRTHHPAWRLLRSDHAAFIASFLHRVFVEPNLRSIDASDLAEMLEDQLYALRQQLGDSAFPKQAIEYLNDWAAPEKGWLRKFYKTGSDEAQFDITPATEKALAWLDKLGERQFIGTESRLLTLFDLLRQISEGSEIDPDKRIAELKRRRAEIDAEIARTEAGDFAMLDSTALKDRFQQFLQGSRELLADFREVEHNFRQLDRRVRERITLWEGHKGELLEQIMGERDQIADSDQGRSFRAFWDFLLSSQRQEELTERLDQILSLPQLMELTPDARLRRVHYDWMEAGEHTQRTVASLSQQLRRFLDDQAWLENRRIMDILQGIESKALALREQPPQGDIIALDLAGIDIELPMERPLYRPPIKLQIEQLSVELGDEEINPSALFDQIVIDKTLLRRQVRQALQDRTQITLHQLVASHPLEQGLAELIAYLQLDDEGFTTLIDEQCAEPIRWRGTQSDGQVIEKVAQMPRVIFTR